jgi:hypothetical protein
VGEEVQSFTQDTVETHVVMAKGRALMYCRMPPRRRRPRAKGAVTAEETASERESVASDSSFDSDTEVDDPSYLEVYYTPAENKYTDDYPQPWELRWRLSGPTTATLFREDYTLCQSYYGTKRNREQVKQILEAFFKDQKAKGKVERYQVRKTFLR